MWALTQSCVTPRLVVPNATRSQALHKKQIFYRLVGAFLHSSTGLPRQELSFHPSKLSSWDFFSHMKFSLNYFIMNLVTFSMRSWQEFQGKLGKSKGCNKIATLT